MSEEDFFSLFEELALADLPGQRRRISQEIKRICADDAAKGLRKSGAHFRHITSALESELSTRAQEVRTNAFRSLGAGILDERAPSLALMTKATHEKILSFANELITIFNNEVPENLRQHLPFSESISEILKRNSVEIKVTVMNEKNKNPDAANFNNIFNGTVGVVQQGNATAAATQTIVNNSTKEIEAALDGILAELRSSTEVDNQTRSDMIELVQEGRKSLQIDRPNKFKISGFVSELKNVAELVPKIKEASAIVIAGIQTLGF